jgi:mxaJ protein
MLIAAVLSAQCARGAAASTPAAVETSRVLRVCADPNNLPFSNQALEGFENRIATLLGNDLHARIDYVWWAQRRGFVRNTLRAGLCDVVMGVPTDFEQAATTRPYYRSSYVFVAKRGSHLPSSFDDPYLRTARIGVALIGDDSSNSPPAHALSNRGVIDNVHGYTVYGDYKTPNPPAALIDAVDRGEIDVAVAWGPLAGFFARRSHTPLQLARVTPGEEPPFPFVFDMSMGVARSNKALRDELNQFIARNQSAIDVVLRDYAVPVIEPRTVAAR